MARKRFNFWLDDQRQEDWKINELITNLKGKGQFTRAIREGLRLWADLRAGNVSVLCELFPQAAEQLGAVRLPSGDSGAGGQSDLAREIAAQIILMGGTGGYTMQSLPTTTPPKQKPAAAPPKAEIKAAVAVSADAIADNFLNFFD